MFLSVSCMPFTIFPSAAFSRCLLGCSDTSLALMPVSQGYDTRPFQEMLPFHYPCTSCWCRGCCGQPHILLLIVGIVLLIAHTCLCYASERIAMSVILIYEIEKFLLLQALRFVFCTCMRIVCFWKRWLPSHLSSFLPILTHISEKPLFFFFFFCM